MKELQSMPVSEIESVIYLITPPSHKKGSNTALYAIFINNYYKVPTSSYWERASSKRLKYSDEFLKYHG